MARRGLLNKFKLIGIKGGQNGKKAHFFLDFHAQEREKRGCRERNSNFSLRSTKLGWSSHIGPRLKVGVLVEGNVWTPK